MTDKDSTIEELAESINDYAAKLYRAVTSDPPPGLADGENKEEGELLIQSFNMYLANCIAQLGAGQWRLKPVDAVAKELDNVMTRYDD